MYKTNSLSVKYCICHYVVIVILHYNGQKYIMVRITPCTNFTINIWPLAIEFLLIYYSLDIKTTTFINNIHIFLQIPHSRLHLDGMWIYVKIHKLFGRKQWYDTNSLVSQLGPSCNRHNSQPHQDKCPTSKQGEPIRAQDCILSLILTVAQF